jgi:purine-nucleoside phosphorylase
MPQNNILQDQEKNMSSTYPILEFDSSVNAILNPQPGKPNRNIPHKAVLCFFQDVLTRLVSEGRIQEIGCLRSEIGKNPYYLLIHEEQELLVMHPGVGAPLAVGFMEELIALGVNSIIACGGCGVLHKDFRTGEPMIVTSAVRDEGTSYHYLPPSREVIAQPKAVKALETVFKQKNLEYRLGKTWTTDALYRETIKRREERVGEGCLTVEMEASAFMAVANFRNINFGQLLYGGDLVVPEGWDKRGWDSRESIRQHLFWLAAEASLLL